MSDRGFPTAPEAHVEMSNDDLQIFAAAPAAFTDAERADFSELVRAGGEVGGNALAANLTNAKALVVAMRDQAMQGIAALKRPQASYRKRIGAKTGVDLSETVFPYELGYIFILPDARRRKLSHRLVAAALEEAEGAAVFATTRAENAAMLAALAKASFTTVGQPYRGRNARTTIQLLTRPGAATRQLRGS